ncbi:MAG: RagB/SusD family nutrient uptake outer membrane protein, partial [Bacteroidetes bacterium]|nr:RagB/SusD family nutrient uptake outer membrane protein [Bacteroidota bacterium]
MSAGILLIAITIFSSCEKDFLEKPKGSDITMDTVFTSTQNAQQMIFLLYEGNYFSPANLALHWWDPKGYASWSEIGEDIYVYTGKPSDYGAQIAYYDGTFSPSSRQFYPINTLYYAVRHANIFLERAPNIITSSPDDAEYLKRMTGEAYAHLAYQYFYGMKLWGTIPIVDKVLVGGEEPITRPAFSEYIDKIVEYCDQAIEMLPAKWEDRWTGRFTSVAAKALKAKILVYAASPLYNGPTPEYAAGYEHPEVLGYTNYDKTRWKRAADACKDAIDAAHAAGHQLYTGSGTDKNLYHLAINLTNEHILYERYKDANAEGGWKYTLYMMNQPYGIGWYTREDLMYQPTMNHVDGYQLANGKFPISGYTGGDPTKPVISDAGVTAGYTDQNYHVNRDPRFYQNIVYHGSKFGESYNTKLVNFDINKSVANRTHGDWLGFKTSFMLRKFINEELGKGSDVKYNPIHPIFRLADLYLLYAEALSEYNDGPTAEGLTFFNQVRARSGMPVYDAANYQGGNNREKFFNAIVYERKAEFFMESQRYFDLRRWKKGSDLNLKMAGILINNGIVSRNDIG